MGRRGPWAGGNRGRDRGIGEQQPANAARSSWRRRTDSFGRSMWGPILCWSVVLLEIGAWAAMREGDAMVIPTLLAYGARWVWLIPAVAIAPLIVWRRSLLLPVALAFGVGLVGVMQFQWPHLAPRESCC